VKEVILFSEEVVDGICEHAGRVPDLGYDIGTFQA